jgi:hypothetical protein
VIEVFSLLTQLLVLTPGQVPLSSPPKAQSNESNKEIGSAIPARRWLQESDLALDSFGNSSGSQFVLGAREPVLQRSEILAGTTRYQWLQKNALDGIATSWLFPLAGQERNSYQTVLNGFVISPSLQASAISSQNDLWAGAGQRLAYGQPVGQPSSPQVKAAARHSLSGYRQASRALAQTTLLSRGQDGSWTLAYKTSPLGFAGQIDRPAQPKVVPSSSSIPSFSDASLRPAQQAVASTAGSQSVARQPAVDQPVASRFFGNGSTNASTTASQKVWPSVNAAATPNFSAQSTVVKTGALDRRLPSNPVQARGTVLTRAADGSWALAYQSDRAPQLQTAISEISNAVACAGHACRGLSYIEQQLPKTRQQAINLQAKLEDLETRYGQQDMAAYQKVLNDRTIEVAQQKEQLSLNVMQTQQQITEARSQMALMAVNFDVVERALAQSSDYQTAWQRLQQIERGLLEEFSQVDIDATALNAIYSDYQYQQSSTQQTANDALINYVANGNLQIERAPESMALLKEGVTLTYQQRIQNLRQETIDQLEQRIKTRQTQLASHLSEYEQVQRQLAAAQQLTAQYEQTRDRLMAQAQNSDVAIAQQNQQDLQRSQSLDLMALARTLAKRLPEGSSAQAILYTVLALGAVSAIMTYRRSKSSVPAMVPVMVPNGESWSSSFYAAPSSAPALAKAWSLDNAPFHRRFEAPVARPVQVAARPAADKAAARHSDLTASVGAVAKPSKGIVKPAEGIVPPVVARPAALAPAESSAALAALDEFGWLDVIPEEDAFDETLFYGTGTGSLFQDEALKESSCAESEKAEIEERDLLAEALFEKQLFSPDASAQSDDDFEQRILAELLEIVGQSVRLVDDFDAASADESQILESVETQGFVPADSLEDSLTIEIMSRKLSEMLQQSTVEGSLKSEIERRAIAPVNLSPEEVNLFATQAIRWVIKKINASSPASSLATELDAAELDAAIENAGQLDAQPVGGNSSSQVTSVQEAIDIESLELWV